MPDSGEKVQIEKKQGEAEQKIELKQLKKPTYGISVFFSIGGMMVALVLAFLINDALDKTQNAIGSNLQSIDRLLLDVGESASALQAEVLSLNTTFDDLNDSVSTLAGGIEGTGKAVKGFGDMVTQLGPLASSLSGYSANLTASGDALINGSAGLRKVGELAGERKGISDLSSSLEKIENDLNRQRASVSETGDAIVSIIGTMKLANILVFVMFIIMFSVLFLNSAAGIL